ncbi:MAG: DEAD/DEAH box helicase [Acidimicrobiales bacterium]
MSAEVSRTSHVRDAFVFRLGFQLDPFQSKACDALDAGRSVLVSAPTGSGKTVVANYAVARAVADGRKAFYTTPLKALSNQKFAELSAVYGRERTGLLTGDISHRPDAPVVVMTTEVLRNMFFARAPVLDGLGLVVLDEVHYLQDPYRGSVWEEVMILTPPEVVMVCLSATVSNAEQLGAWLSNVRGPTEVVVERRRPVELLNHVAIAERGTSNVDLVPLLDDGRLHPRATALDQRVARMRRRGGGLGHSRLVSPRRTELIDALGAKGMLPAIIFVFSRAGCDAAVTQCLDDGLRLTAPAQRDEIRRRCESHTEGLSEEELRALGYGTWCAGLEAGVASHHAGLIPAFREAVEDCFSSGLLGVVFATETLSLGINMPARTVVVEKLSKVRSEGRAGLTSGEYAQLTGRAGRRGLDPVGHAVTLWRPQVSLRDLASLATSPAPALTSSFRPTYNLAVNLVRRYPAHQAHYVLDRSFAQFLDRRHHNALSRHLERALGLLERWGYLEIDSWQLSERGQLLARVYHESDLLVSEALSEGILDGLDAPTLAAVLSACTFEARAGRRRTEPRPPKEAKPRLAAMVALWERLHAEEQEARLAKTRAPDPSFAEAAWRWARGERLVRVLERAELSAGDFVRNAKQLVDLLSQIAVVAPRRSTAAVATQAAKAIRRGVVATSLWPVATGPVAGPEDDVPPASSGASSTFPGRAGSTTSGQPRP